jgi:spermidine/putrescine transport system substrate-binding protein
VKDSAAVDVRRLTPWGGRRLSRRQFLIGSGALGSGGAALLSACGGNNSGPGPDGRADGTLSFENWGAYIDPTRDGSPGTVDRFRQATGIDVGYAETINDNAEYFAKIQPLLGAGRTIDADLIVPTSWLAARLIRLGWVDPLPLDQVPNAVNLDDSLVRPNWDPTGEYSLPWQSIIIGIGYNLDAAGREIRSLKDLFAPELKGRVGFLTEMVDTIGLLMLERDIDPGTVSSFDEAAPAFERLEQAKVSGQVRAFTGGDFIDDLSSGNFAACMAWSADVLQLTRDNPAVRFVIPEEGGFRGVDTMLMPKGADSRTAAARWMNFVYDPVQAARITAFVQAVTPVDGVQEELAKFDEALAADPLLFPDAATRARLNFFPNLDEDVAQRFDETFSRIIGA